MDTGDDSAWYTNGINPVLKGYVVHCAADGSLIWEGEFTDPYDIAVNPRDGSCWVLELNELIYLAADGTELWRGAYRSVYGSAGSIAVDPKDGSCRISDGLDGYVARLNVVDVPQAAFVAKPMAGQAPLTVTFEDWSLGTPDSCLWDFGDGATSTEENPTHSYSSPGGYTVTLTVSNRYGTDTVTCCIDCLVPQCATRTPGYWFTHPDALLAAFYALADANSNTNNSVTLLILCTDDGCAVTPEDAMAIFWEARGLRATLAQQILAAIFNNALLKPAPEGIIEAALAVLCDPYSTNDEISAAKAPLVCYNESATWLPILWYDFGSADPKVAKAMASYGLVPNCVEPADDLDRSGRLLKR